MVKRILSFLLILFGIIILLSGDFVYRAKLRNTVASKTIKSSFVSSKSSEKSNNSLKLSRTQQNLLKNLPMDIQTKLKTVAKKKKTIQFTLVVQSNTPVITKLESAMAKAYGKDFWHFNLITYGDGTSTALLNGKLKTQVAATHPDVILYEAPLLTDNLNISDTESLASNTQLLSEFAQTNAAVLVEPSNPIYKANVYPTQEANFKSVVSPKYTYLDYWTAYPATATDAMKQLVVDDGIYHTLNDAGYAVWANYLINEFVAR